MKNILFFILLFISLNIFALDRVALVIGNADYQINPLKNPTNDAIDISISHKIINVKVKHQMIYILI